MVHPDKKHLRIYFSDIMAENWGTLEKRVNLFIMSALEGAEAEVREYKPLNPSVLL